MKSVATPSRKPSGLAVGFIALAGILSACAQDAAPTNAVTEEKTSGQAEASATKTFTPGAGAPRTYLATSVQVPMRDGAYLTGNLITPGDGKPAPVVVSITPYGRHGGYNFGVRLARLGFAALLLDTRGRGDSGGEFTMLAGDLNDTPDVIAWAAEQPFSNGKVTMWGSSYGGYNQWMAAAKQAPALNTITPGASVYPGWDYPIVTGVSYPYAAIWPGFTKGRTANFQLLGDQVYWREAFTDFYTQGLPFRDLDEFVGFDTDLFDLWQEHPDIDEYWKRINPSDEEMANIDMPILSMTGPLRWRANWGASVLRPTYEHCFGRR